MGSFNWLRIPFFSIKKVYNDDLKIIYYELYLNHSYEGRYNTVEALNYRISLIITDEAISTEV